MFVPFGLKFGDAKRCSFRLARTMAFCFIAVAILAANIRARSSLAFGPGASDVSPSLSLQTVEESITESPESLAVALERALSKGQNETAQEILSQILKRPHVNADLLLKVGAGLAQRELYAEASQVFARCVGENPGIFEAHYDLALAEFAQQKLPEALAALRDAPQGSKDENLGLLYLRGKIESALGRTLDAERDLSAAFSGAPQRENYALDLGLFRLQQQDYFRAAQTFERGASFNPRSPFLALGLALAQFLSAHEAQSVETSKKLLALQPDFSPARLLMAFALYEEGKLEDAERVAAEGLAPPQPDAYLYYLDAVILLKRGSPDDGRILRELAIAENTIPSCSLCYLAESKAHLALGDLKAAIADLESAVRLGPDLAEAWYRLAPLYDQVGRHVDAASAREQFQKLKADKENRESEMIRNIFMRALSTTEPSGLHP